MSELLFRFGIISDTHVRAPGGDRSSPFPVNEKANSRAEFAARLLALHEPEFTVHLGDMVHPLPHMEAYDPACVEAKRYFACFGDAIHYVSGNHDIGDKPMPASPASPVNDAAVDAYGKHFGEMWYRFDHGPLSILVINSSLVNTHTEREQQQKAWLESALQKLDAEPDRRIFVFSHYPPFIHSTDEPEHYDNYAEPGRSWMLELLERHQVEAVFSGHVHHYFRNRHASTDLYCLPATSFTRQDYAEMYRVGPTAEFGRDDSGKMHVALVEVFDDGYRLRMIPTFGQGREQAPTHYPAPVEQPATMHLRHAWHESIDLPYNGPMEEFSRKRAHNDYTLLRLLQLGFHDVRVPIQDVMDDQIAGRVEAYRLSGVRFHGMLLGGGLSLQSSQRQSVARHLSSLEYVMPDYPHDAEEMVSYAEPAARLAESLPTTPLWLSAARTSSEKLETDQQSAGVYAHSVTSGFAVSDCDYVFAALVTLCNPELEDNLKGVVFQIPWGSELSAIFLQISEACEHASALIKAKAKVKDKSKDKTLPEISAQLVIRLAPANPAHSNYDDEAIAEYVSQSLALVKTYKNLSLQFDTFVDVDRGYAPRHGFLDRHFNYRKVSLALLKP